jgi:hypothetical protein
MKKGDVVQLAVIILALLLAYATLSYIIGGIAQMMYLLMPGDTYSGAWLTGMAGLLFAGLVQLLLSWLLLLRSRKIADFIYEKASIGTSFAVISRPADLLYVLLIVVGFYSLLENLPPVIKAVGTAFKSKATASRFEMYEPVKPPDWATLFIRLLLPLILLMFAKPIASYFAQHVNEEPVSIGDNMEDIETTEPTKG